MNNYEKIKAMTLDEMAEFLDESPCLHCSDDKSNNKCDCLKKCRKHIKQWLQQESKGRMISKAEKEVKDIKNEWVERKDKIKDLANAIVNGTHFTNDIEGHLKELAKEIINICEEL